MLKAVGIAGNDVGVELVEVNPLLDPTHLTPYTGNRILRQPLIGMAMRKEDIADPFYVDPERLKHRAPI